MSRLRRAAIALILPAALASLSACGFRPVYGGKALAGIEGVHVVGSGEERIDFLIETAVREQVRGSAGDSPYRLSLTTTARETGLGVAGDGRATRYAIEVAASYTLERAGGGEAPIRGRVDERVVYEAPRDPFALLSARSAAEDRAAQQVGRSVVQSLSLALRERNDPDFDR